MKSTAPREQLHTELTEKIIGAAIKVHTILGPGFDHNIYSSALMVEFDKQGLSFENDWLVKVYYEAVNIGEYKLDFLIQDKVIVKILATDHIESRYMHQVKSQLAASGLKVGLVLNFGNSTLDIKRVEPRVLKAREKKQSKN